MVVRMIIWTHTTPTKLAVPIKTLLKTIQVYVCSLVFIGELMIQVFLYHQHIDHDGEPKDFLHHRTMGRTATNKIFHPFHGAPGRFFGYWTNGLFKFKPIKEHRGPYPPSNPADILSKHGEFAGIWLLLQPPFFWEGDTGKLTAKTTGE